MSLAVGDRLGPYEILAPIGAGGMGEVYRARDTKLKRDVALKVLPEAFARDPERLARFEREAEVLASLNHPNIASIYGVVEDRALVMELVEGAEPKGPRSFDEAWAIASQIAAALEYAHEKGVVHRDLKPANIKVTPEGTMKLLDFGLAKAFTNQREPSASPEHSPTLTLGATEMGVILGTAAYMAPEQARGKAVDKRADIWSFGVVLYELLTGERLFTGEDAAETLAAVIHKQPDLAKVPRQARRLIGECLQKDPKQRLRDIGDAKRVLSSEGGAGSEPEADSQSAPSRFGKIAMVAAAAMTIVAAGLGFGYYRATRPAELKPLVRLDVDLGADVTLGSAVGTDTIISPDGTRLVYVSQEKLFARKMDQPKAVELVGTDGAFAPFFSPDGQWVAFFTGGKLKKISVEGGAAVALCDVTNNARGGSWGEDGNIIAALTTTGGLSRVPSAGGAPTAVTQLAQGEATQRWPQILPGGKAVLFTSLISGGGGGAKIEVVSLADRRRKTLERGGTFGRYLPASNGMGHLVYIDKGTLFAATFDPDKLEVRGTPSPVIEGVSYSPAIGFAQFDFSRNGTLVYRSGGGSGLLTVAWLDGEGKAQPLLAKPGAYGRPSLSPDGQRLALEVTEGSGTDIWVYDWQRDTMTRLTFTGTDVDPAWSPDGRYIVFRTVGGGMSVTRSDGAGKPQPLTQSKNIQYPWSFTPDGKRLGFHEASSGSSWGLWTVPLESDGVGLRAGKPEVLLQTPAQARYPSFSPDGRWLAYSSNESGTYQIYVRAFPDKGGKWQISNIDGTYPMWSRDGHELFFEALDSRIMVAAYAVKGDSFVADRPRLWSEKKIGGSVNNVKNIDLAPDGRRIAALMPVEGAGAQQSQSHVIFLLNFFDELQRKVPTGK